MKRFNIAMIDRGDFKAYIPAVRRISFFLFLMLTGIVSAANGESFSVLGVTLPTLNDSLHHCLQTSDTIYQVRHQKSVAVNFYLSAEGCVDSLTYDTATGGHHIRAVGSSLQCLDFNPAEVDGEATPFILPARAVFENKRGWAGLNLLFPYDSSTGNKNSDLIADALALNGIVPPGIKRFPSYYCRCATIGSDLGYHYAGFELDLDSGGTLLDFEPLFASHQPFADMLGTVLQYAEYSPATRFDKQLPSHCFLIVRFFTELHYPTAIWPPDDKTSQLFENYRLEMSLYLDSIPFPPVPVNLPDGVINVDHVLPHHDAMAVRIGIDTVGQIDYVYSGAKLSGSEYAELRGILQRLRFYPARDLYGRRLYYDCDLELNTNTSKKIRIVAKWLPRSVQGGGFVR